MLAPLFLLGALAVGLPLWLHLLQRENPIRLPFSSLMFFEKRKQTTFLQRRFRYLLLLALRCAIYALIALAFAKPIWERPPTTMVSDIPALHLIVLDTSLSMNHSNHWDQAVAEARTIINDLDGAAQAQILTTGPSVDVVTQASRDKVELLSALESLEPNSSRNAYADVLEAVRSLTPDADTPVELHLISDYQNTATPGRFSDLVLPTVAQLDVRNVGDPNAENWAIESVKGSTRIFDTSETKLEATIAAFSSRAVRKTVTLEIDGKQLASESKEVPAMGRASFQFAGFEAPNGFSRVEIKLSPADDLPGDDVRLVALDNSEPESILFISNDRRRRDALYYRSALDSSTEVAFRAQVSSPGEAERLSPHDFGLVVVSDVAQLSNRFVEKLKSYVESGGAALFAVGPQIATRGTVPLTDHKVSPSAMRERSRGGFHAVGVVDASHPALGRIERFQGVKFFRYARVQVTEEDETPITLANGAPLLVERKLGNGRVFIFASAFDNVWNDLPVLPVFVPFVVETARYLSGLDEGMRQSIVDSLLELRRRRDSSSTVQVFDPNGDRALSLSASVTQQDLPLDQVGFYELRSPSGVELIAVNPDPRESNIRQIDEDTMSLWQSTGRGANSAAAGAEEASIKPPPIRIWRLLLFLLAAIVLLESVVGNWHLNVRRET